MELVPWHSRIQINNSKTYQIEMYFYKKNPKIVDNSYDSTHTYNYK